MMLRTLSTLIDINIISTQTYELDFLTVSFLMAKVAKTQRSQRW